MPLQNFYDELAPYYQWIYQDWPASVERQADILDAVIREYFGGQVHSILDAACGIGTQAIGLAARGYSVSASDISPGELEQARFQAAQRKLDIPFQVADMRRLDQAYPSQFDLVIACDNAIPHLLTDDEIQQTFKQFFERTTPGGGCIISVRDYDATPRGGRQMHPRTVHETPQGKIIIMDLWEFDGDYYDLSMYVVTDPGAGKPPSVQAIRGGRYYCVGIPRLEQLMKAAGFPRVAVLRERFFQPLLVGLKG